MKYTRIYKPQIGIFNMVKNELEKRNAQKGCYGTNEWSENSGICRQCKWKDDCGKIRKKKVG